ncbi:MAG TPA: ribose-5-phosphate isomerase RpiA [Parvularculaceae bacterium]|nr:ribose-5-phosphate isomerase RpiA [Parvularculaceae bacterium]
MSADDYKKAAALAAIGEVRPGMTLGLGTGSTAAHFIAALGEKACEGFGLRAVPTSEDTARKAAAVGIEIIEPDETTIIDLAVDGADEADGAKRLIKGGGGALLREKIVAAAARRFVVIADASKRVAELGAFPLPVEIDCFSYALTVRAVRETLASLGYAKPDIRLRAGPEGLSFLSDGGHYILDCRLGRIGAPEDLDKALKAVPGVIETGLFIGLADEVILAGPDGVQRIA